MTPRLILFGAILASSSACVHARRPAAGYNVSSERSDYSPVVRLAVSVPAPPSDGETDDIDVVIDSAIVTAPGTIAADTAPVMRNLFISALLATAPSGAKDRKGPPEPWHAIAESNKVPLVDALRLGEPRATGGVRLHIAAPTFDPSRTWLVFRITAGVMTQEVRLADGTVIPPRLVESGVRVFACADWTLAGVVDRRRAKALARAYTAAC